jgi:hypothetical protein
VNFGSFRDRLFTTQAISGESLDMGSVFAEKLLNGDLDE